MASQIIFLDDNGNFKKVPTGADLFHLQLDAADPTGFSWVAAGGGSTAMGDLSDVTLTSEGDGELLRFNGSIWINNTLAEAGISAVGHTHAMTDLSDMTQTSAADGEVMRFDGADWINNTLAEASISVVGHSHTLSDVTDSGTLAAQNTVNDGDWSGTDLAILNGGTGQSTQTAGFDALSPTTTKGDVVVDDGTNAIRLAVGSDDQVLTADAAEASGVKWAAAGAAGAGWTLIANVPTTSGTSVTHAAGDMDTFDELLFIFRAISTTSGSADLTWQFSDDGASTFENVQGHANGIEASTHFEFAYSGSSSSISCGDFDSSANELFGYFRLNGNLIAENALWELNAGFDVINEQHMRGTGIINGTTAAIDAVRITTDSGSFDAGSFSIWGR